MSPLNQTLIHRKAKLITDDLEKLKTYAHLSPADYHATETNELIVERLLERIIGRLIDINFHLLKEQFNELPKDYYESFIKLAQHNVIDPDLANRLAPATATRNIIAHEYDEVDPQQIYQSMQLALKLIPQYLQKVLKYLSSIV